MIEIEIAGAGAGKTYGLAKKILSNSDDQIPKGKKIVAITFTNKAKKNIIEKIIELKGSIPKSVYVDTVHSFLLNEIIFPYSNYILNEVYTKAVSIPLSSNIKFKQYKKKQLKEKNIIHNTDVYKKSKIILDRSNSKHSNKKKKKNVDLVITHIKSAIEKIYLDEAQDLDDDALKSFKILAKNGIPIYMIGDPKQAIKFPNAFENFIKFNCKEKPEIITLLPINNISRRIPEEIINISNKFCPKDQIQTSISKVKGGILYVSSDSSHFNNFLDYSIENGHLIYIEKKEGKYETKNTSKIEFPVSVEEKLKLISHTLKLNEELFLKSVLSEISSQVQLKSIGSIIKNFTQKYCLTILNSEYAELAESLKSLVNNDNSYIISSIDSIKGLEADNCVFILNENTLKYFLQVDLEKVKHHNKIWKKIYVALTRSSKLLFIVLDSELLPKQDFKILKEKFEELGIHNYERNLQELLPTSVKRK